MLKIDERTLWCTIVLALLVSACSTVYYSAWETLGREKRDLLRDNVEGVQKDQQAVSEQFATTLDRIRTLYGLDDGALEHQYDRLSKSYEQSVSRSDALRSRIAKVEEIAADLFSEWGGELKQISDPGLRASSRDQLEQTQARYATLQTSLRGSEKGMDPVLQKFKDQVLFLKHNLNAQAIGSLATEVGGIEADVAALIADLEVSIAEADEFIRGLPE